MHLDLGKADPQEKAIKTVACVSDSLRPMQVGHSVR